MELGVAFVPGTPMSANLNAYRAILHATAVKLIRLIVYSVQKEIISPLKTLHLVLATTSVPLTVLIALSQITVPIATEISYLMMMAAASVLATASLMELSARHVPLHVMAVLVRRRHVLTAQMTWCPLTTELGVATLALTVLIA